MFLSISFFQVVFNTCFFKSILFAVQITHNLFKLARKNLQSAKLKQIIFFTNDHIALGFYYLKAGKTQQQGEWMENAWF